MPIAGPFAMTNNVPNAIRKIGPVTCPFSRDRAHNRPARVSLPKFALRSALPYAKGLIRLIRKGGRVV